MFKKRECASVEGPHGRLIFKEVSSEVGEVIKIGRSKSDQSTLDRSAIIVRGSKKPKTFADSLYLLMRSPWRW